MCSKTSKYAKKICNIRFSFWGPHNLIGKDPKFQVPITFQIEYANMENSGLDIIAYRMRYDQADCPTFELYSILQQRPIHFY